MKKSKKLRKIIRSATNGKPGAMYLMGKRCETGKELPLDKTSAEIWMEAAADAGFEPAIKWLEQNRKA